MIDFSKDVQMSNQVSQTKKADEKKIHNRTDMNIHIDYDFADRDVQKLQEDNGILGRKVTEEEKIEKPESDDRLKRRKQRFSETAGYSHNETDVDFELCR